MIPQRHKKIIREYYNNLKETYLFLKSYNLPRLNQRERDNLNRLIICSETEFAIKKKKKNLVNGSPGLDGFTGKFY